MTPSRPLRALAQKIGLFLLALAGGLAAVYWLGSLLRPSLQSRLLEVALLFVGMKRNMNSQDPLLTVDYKAPNEAPSRNMHQRYSVTMREIHGSKVYTVAPRQGASREHIYYLHGGAYVHGFAREHWQFIGRLVDRLGCTVTAPDYPLAPASHVDDVFALVLPLYRELAAQVGAAHLTVMGDSAGGGMSLALAQRLRDEGGPQPARLVLLAPWLDVTMSNPAIAAIDRIDPFLGVQGLIADGRMYAGEASPTDPLISPVYGDIADLAPISVFIGTRDVLFPDCQKLRMMAEAQGIPLDYREYKDMVHVWMLAGILPEAREALNDIVTIVQG